MRQRAKLAVTLALLAGVSMVAWLGLDRMGPDRLRIEAGVEQREDGLVELRLTWVWDLPSRLVALPWREELLAVSFDTGELLFEAEEASYGVGARGDCLRLLEEVAGFNGARRLFVVPVGRDGEARVILRPTGRDGDGLIQVHAVVAPGRGEGAVWALMVARPAANPSTGEGTRSSRSET